MRVTLVGIGMGTPATLTNEAADALRSAKVVLGASRLLAGLPDEVTAEKVSAPTPDQVAACLKAHPEWDAVCVALSGDVGFYSGAKRLLELLDHFQPTLISGISTPQYFAARLGRPWQDWHLVSAHGVACDVVGEVAGHCRTMFLAGGEWSAKAIAESLVAGGFGQVRMTVGQNLSYPDESITTGTAVEIAGMTFASLAAVLVENDAASPSRDRCPGLADDEFVRGDAPMTKREIRATAMSLLQPARNAVLYDIGAGTGSVAVELAAWACQGRVYAIERDAAACRLAAANRDKFALTNLHLIHGAAPEALAGLPAADAVFIGGSSGRLRDIIAAVLATNPCAGIVVSAITVETLSEAVATMRERAMSDVEIVQIAASRAAPVGKLHMFKAMNPVFLIYGKGGGDGV
ncbi:MAG: precorrin-6y C5,15-methyltransferase (decarboxylating) subunit CbiE [Planctomycetes bacterium]|nr:precorrin-6y C5,15-methyltransferase (decarboxylating) subunit CbiE [Planctomycetota bacterium]